MKFMLALNLVLAVPLSATTIESTVGKGAFHTQDGKSLEKQIFLDIKPETPVEQLEGLTYRANNNHDGHYKASGVPSLKGVRWKVKTGGRIFSNPCSDGKIVYFGSEDNNVYAVDLKTGQEVWKFATKGQVFSSPTLYNGVLYIGSLDATLYALDAASGKEVWKVKRGKPETLKGDPSSTGKMDGMSSPTVAHGLVFMALGDTVFGFDLKTGEEKWGNVRSGKPQQLAAATVYKHRIYYGHGHTRMRAWNLITLDEEIRFPEAGNDDMSYTPAIWNDRIYYLGHHGYIYGCDASKAKPNRDWINIFKGGETFIPSGDSRGNKSGGNKGPTDIKFKTEIATPSVADGRVVYGCTGGAVIGKDAETGKDVWIFDTGGWVRVPAGIAAGVAYIGSSDQKFYALDLQTGAKKWDFDAGSPVTGPAWVGDGATVFGVADGTVFCLE